MVVGGGAVHLAKSAVSPGYRRWRRLLRSLTLDLREVHEPIVGPSAPDFLICGPPRSGTALATAALFQPPRVITVMEPWDALRMLPGQLVDSIRDEIVTTGYLGRGRLDVERLAEGQVRWCRDGEKPVHVDFSAETAIGVKLPGFWRYLSLLPDTRFVVCLREPAEILASFASTTGRLREGYEYDVPFYGELNRELASATGDPAVRRALMLERVLGEIAQHVDRPEVLVVRYERWFVEPDEVMADLSAFLGFELATGTIEIRPPESAGFASSRDRELVRDLVPSAAVLGYPT